MQREKNNKIFFGNISFCCCCKYINIDLTPTTMTTTAKRTSTAMQMQLHDNLHINLFSLSISLSLCMVVGGASHCPPYFSDLTSSTFCSAVLALSVIIRSFSQSLGLSFWLAVCQLVGFGFVK